MNNTISCGRSPIRLLAAFLCAVLVFTLVPASAFAWPSSGHSASSWYGDQVAGSDGKTYNYPSSWSFMLYHKDGTTSYGTYAGGSPYTHYMLTDAAGSSRWVYCAESGVAFNAASDAYDSKSGKNSDYLDLLPAASQRGIKIASLYGWHPGAALPLSGINANDWYMAAQVIIWEYQQQLRSDPYSRHANGVVSANQFYNVIKGRPAERVYDWMLDKIASHTTLPSFAGVSAGSAPVHELKWDTADKVYRLTLTDTNNLNIDFERLAGAGVTVTRSGNKYTFTSAKMITEPVTFQYRKNVPIADDMLIWGRPGHQTMLTGAEDPVTFFVRIKTETYGTARIVKASEDGIVSGITFTIAGTDVLGNTVNETVITGEGGRIDKKLLPGTYLVRETAPVRYVQPASQYVTVESGQTAAVSFVNILKKFRVLLTKTDADTGAAQGDASLGGAVYGIYKGGELIDTYTTDADGRFLTRYYVCSDDWTIREISPSAGYLLDTEVHKIAAEPGLYEIELNTAENRVTEKVIYGDIRLVKHTDDPDEDVAEGEHTDAGNAGMAEHPEAGAVFEVYLRSAGSYADAKPSERDILTTDDDGFAKSKKLPYGRYAVHQIKGAYGKAFISDFTVFISADGFTYSYILNNDAITGRLRIEKRDAETGKLIPAPGTGFKVKSLAADGFITQKIYYPTPAELDTFYTSDEGRLMLPEALPMGNYELYEVQAPFGYVLGSEPVPFTVDGSEAVITAVQKNTPQKSRITLTKTGEVFSSVISENGLYVPVYEAMGLPGAVYDIVADEDIYTPDGTLRHTKDEVVETITTGDDAKAVSGLLYLGRYRLQETAAPFGMVRNTEPVTVELTYAGQDVEVTDTYLSAYDERQKVRVDLRKLIERDDIFGNGSGDEYRDVTFGLFAAHDIESLDGGVIPKDGLMETVQVSPSGGDGIYTAQFTADLPFGSYYIKELQTNKAYVPDDAKYPVIFAYEGQDVTTVNITANDGEPVRNEILRGRIAGIKYGEDRENGEMNPLAGALIGLFSPNDEVTDENTALLTAVSAEDGSFAFEDIPFGHWIIREIKAPEGYSVSTEQHHVYIGTDGQVIELRMENSLIRGSVQLLKTEAAGTADKDGSPFMRRLEGAVFEVYADTDNNKEFGEADTLIGEMTEADGGLHSMGSLLFGGYFVKEKSAPLGYAIDEAAYYFEIKEDGQTVTIENGEAGSGFVNEAYRGSLRIVKDSSDGRKDGFAFEVKSKDGAYSGIFTTDGTGIIEIKNLRTGTYTVREISNRASRGYIIPDNVSAEIRKDETVTVTFYNERQDTSVTSSAQDGKSVPQTSDDGMAVIWTYLLAASLIGAGVFAVTCVRSKRAGKRKTLRICVFALCALTALGSSFLLISEVGVYKEGADAYVKISGEVKNPATADEDIPADAQVDFSALRELCAGSAAWLLCEDTQIDYPVMQAEDNGYYLKHLPDGSESKVGSLFIDFENTPGFTDRNTIIYGHNMADGSMFASLNSYIDQSYMDAHPRLTLITQEGAYAADVFSAFRAEPGESGTKTSPWALSWESAESYTSWLDAMRERSLVDTDAVPLETDRLLTLSTCTPGGSERFIVMCRLTSLR